ncbi:DUF4064 domain-containing protein [Staphylothermus hellenicus]|uniref:DUF4064 domain-containing protein n=1 Tax=Staphylothermus hellenicus (strain DSM 12710 / JCM 10830 / BK20S6-10-b1 / P8) TaxID=591019 RepID=D7DCC0_STAHD|nr:DUF4064 domain-containing protein [Staphylothermus hellenicus]ADI31817.1 hypothetical protein Shell_0696 [Staphylothermus hellenicus DSM 12710]
MSEKPKAAFILGLIAGILGLLFGIVVLVASSILATIFIGFGGPLILIIGVWWFIAAILIIIGSLWINSGIPSKVRRGGILVLVFSILSLPNWLTCILGLIGGILALVWKPSMQPTQPSQQPPEGEQAV